MSTSLSGTVGGREGRSKEPDGVSRDQAAKIADDGGPPQGGWEFNRSPGGHHIRGADIDDPDGTP
jgi:hypothetical protein